MDTNELHNEETGIDEDKIEEINFFYNQGLRFYEKQHWHHAIKCFNRLLKHVPHHREVLEFRKIAEEKKALDEKIIEAFKKAIEKIEGCQ